MRVMASLLWSLSTVFILVSSEVQDDNVGLLVTSIVDDFESQSHRNLQTRKCHKKAFLNASGNCECMPGFEGIDPSKICTDINECSSTIQPCIASPNTFCINTFGAFKCLCTTDYYYGNPAVTGIACRKRPPKKVDVIEIDPKPKEIDNHIPDVSNIQTIAPTKMKCSGNGSGVNLCGDYINSYCVDLPNGGGYTCKCDEGYLGDPLKGKVCSLTCANPYDNPCGPETKCITTDSGYDCEKKVNSGEECTVMCSPSMHCALVSDGLKSSYKCICNPGMYQPNPFFPCRPIP